MKNIASFVLLVAVLLCSVVSPVLASVAPPAVPEPGTVLLIGGGIGALVLYHRHRRSKK
jgi:NhaP-type Na+/H+ or K+/H+ antiporter